MFSISASLRDHQRGRARRPALRVLADARRGGHEILHWTRHHAGAEADDPAAAAIAADGSLLRARNASGTLFVERVPSPAPGSTFGSWSNLGGATSGTGVALAARAGEALLACVDSGDVKLRTSTDSGATWGSPVSLVTAAASHLALAFDPGGDACLFYTVGATLFRLRRTAGAWAGSGTAWTNTVATLTGVAASHLGGDYHLVVSGTESSTTHPRVWGVAMGDTTLPTNAWTALRTLATADAAATLAFDGAHLVEIDGRLLASFSAVESGDVAATTPHLARPAGEAGATGEWIEPAPFAASTAHGVALAPALDRAWAATASEVWSAPRPGIPSRLDDRLLAARCIAAHDRASCRLVILLDEAGVAGLPGLVAGGSLTVEAGYLSGTNGDPQYGAALGFVVSKVTERTESGRRVAIVEGHGLWEELRAFRQPQAWQVASGTATRGTIHARIAARAGFGAAAVAGTTSAGWGSVQPAFALTPGEDAAAALRRLLATTSEALRHDSVATSLVQGLSESDTPSETYGPSGHPVESIDLIEAGFDDTALRLQGPDRYADDWDPAAVETAGLRRRTVRSLEASSDSLATGWAAAALSRERLERPLARLVVPANAAVQMYDVITVAAPLAGASDRDYRVTAVTLAYERRAGRNFAYTHELLLVAP